MKRLITGVLSVARSGAVLQSLGTASLLVFSYFSASQVAFCQRPSSVVEAWSQMAVQVGSKATIRPLGGSLAEDFNRLWVSEPNIKIDATMRPAPGLDGLDANLPDADSAWFEQPTGTFTLRIDQQCQPGLYDLRGIGPAGVSNPRRILVTQSEVKKLDDQNQNGLAATKLSSGIVYGDTCRAKQYDHYQIDLKAGQYFTLSAYARSLDSRADLNVILLGPDGRELQRSRALGDWPARIEYRAYDSGSYTIRIHDFLFRGGAAFGYLLQCGLADDSTSSLPLELDRLLSPKISMVEDKLKIPSTARSPAMIVGHADSPAEPTASWWQDLPTQIDVSPAEHSENASSRMPVFNPPVEILGEFDQRGQFQLEIEVVQDQRLWFNVRSAQLNQLTDPRLVLFQVSENQNSLRQLVEQDDGPNVGDAAIRLRSLDPYFSWKAPQSGRYQVWLLDIEGGSRPRGSRRLVLSIHPANPRFNLLANLSYPTNNPAGAKPHGSCLLAGGTESIQVFVARQEGFDGAVHLKLEGLPPAVSAPPIIIPAGASEGTFTLIGKSSREDWTGSVKVLGESPGDVQPDSTLARSATIQWQAVPELNRVQSRLTDELVVALRGDRIEPLMTFAGQPQPGKDEEHQDPEHADEGELVDQQVDWALKQANTVFESPQGSELAIPLQVIRRAGASAACILRPRNLPTKTSAAEVNIGGDKSSGELKLKIAADAPIGEYTFWMQVESKVSWQPSLEGVKQAKAIVAALNQWKTQGLLDDAESRLEAAQKELTSRQEQAKAQQLTTWTASLPIRCRILPK